MHFSMHMPIWGRFRAGQEALPTADWMGQCFFFFFLPLPAACCCGEINFEINFAGLLLFAPAVAPSEPRIPPFFTRVETRRCFDGSRVVRRVAEFPRRGRTPPRRIHAEIETFSTTKKQEGEKKKNLTHPLFSPGPRKTKTKYKQQAQGTSSTGDTKDSPGKSTGAGGGRKKSNGGGAASAASCG